jgi:YggT family protein
MSFVAIILWWALRLYSLTLVSRIILDWVRAYNPSWRPRGPLLVVAEIIYTLTDWVLKLVRRFVPPLRLGPVALDIGLIILFVLIGILQNLVSLYLL